MKITSGLVKGYKIKVPPGDRVRPAQSIVRQAIFNMLGESVVGARVLDLFAGSGSLGIEALSRGADWVDFVDMDRKCSDIIKQNLLHTNFRKKSKVYTLTSKRFIDGFIKHLVFVRYDFVFLSPPYAQGIDRILLNSLSELLKSGGVVVFEHSKKTALPKEIEGLKLLDQRTYGAARISFLQKTKTGVLTIKQTPAKIQKMKHLAQLSPSTIAKVLADLAVNLASAWFGVLLVSPGLFGVSSIGQYLWLLTTHLPFGIFGLITAYWLLEKGKIL